MTDVLAAATPTDVSVGHGAPHEPDRASRTHWLIALALLALMGFSLAAHLAALNRDLPVPDTDEDFFVTPAVQIAATGSLNPHWFGHPGSTVIYPVAALVHAWDAVAHDGPIFGTNDELLARYEQSPRPFYLIGRLWTTALAVASIPVLYALGRRAFNRRIALVGAVLWTVLPLPIHFGRIVRTESAAVLFGLLTLYFCVRAWQQPRYRWYILSGVSAGAAISTRWFMVALLPCVLAAAFWPIRADRRRASIAGVFAGATAIVAFALTTPYFLLDFSTARKDLNAEANVSHAIASGFSPPGNVRWYLGRAIPDAISWPIFVIALVGIVLILRRRRPVQLMLLGFILAFVVAISLSKWHWQRWAIQVLPLLALFAAVTIVALSQWLSARMPERLHVGVVVPALMTAALVVVPLSDLADANRVDSATTSRRRALEWMQDNIPPGSRVAEPPDLYNLRGRTVLPAGRGVEVDNQLDPSRPLSEYRNDGYDYIAVHAGAPYAAMTGRETPSDEKAFYTVLACETRLVAKFDDREGRGRAISIYRIDRAPLALLDVLCSQSDPDGAGTSG